MASWFHLPRNPLQIVPCPSHNQKDSPDLQRTDANWIWDQGKQKSGFVIISWFFDFSLLTIPL